MGEMKVGLGCGGRRAFGVGCSASLEIHAQTFDDGRRSKEKKGREAKIRSAGLGKKIEREELANHKGVSPPEEVEKKRRTLRGGKIRGIKWTTMSEICTRWVGCRPREGEALNWPRT